MKHLKTCLACLIAFTLLLAGCTSDSATSVDPYYDSGAVNRAIVDEGGAPLYASEEFDAESTVSANTTSRKVIFSYSYQLETTDMEATLSALDAAVQANGGFVQNASYTSSGDDDQFSFARLTYRVPITSVDAFKDAIESAGQVRTKDETGSDVTDDYFDIEARLTVLNAQEQRLLELLERSGELSDLIEVERELARVRIDIENLTGTLNRYDNLIDLATFTLEIRNVSELTPPSDESFAGQLGRAVLDSLSAALNVLKALLIVLVYALPYLLVAGAIVFVIVFVRKRRRKARKAMQPPPPTGPPNPAKYQDADKAQADGPGNGAQAHEKKPTSSG